MRQRLSILLATALLGCGGTDDTIIDDAGLPDASQQDTTPPAVRDTTPADGAADVPRDAELVIRFSEPMAQDVGIVRVEPGGVGLLATEGTWDAAGSTLRLLPIGTWPSGQVTATIGNEFTDLAGNPLEPTPIVFTTIDDVGPAVTSSTPAEGATGLSARTSEIVIVFNEVMRTTVGTLDALGGAATIGSPTWSAGGTTVTFPVADLEYERDYDVTLRGFVDANGNRLDTRPYLEDGVLDFSTGPDMDGPRALRSEPAEGQVDVNPASTTALLVTFDEAMDLATTSVSLSDGTTSVDLNGSWTGNGRIFRVEVAGRLDFGRTYGLDVTGLRDRAGNAVDGTPYLGDGVLDFTVGADAFRPFVRVATPGEGETDVSYIDTTEITVAFSEAMSPSITTAALSDGTTSVDLTGTWTSPTELSFDVTGRLGAGRGYSLDLRAMQDARGNVLDAAHSYLGDGRLDFTTSAPVGEGCRDPLTIGTATETGGVYRWTISSTAPLVRDGGTQACDTTTSADGNDVVIRFDKVSDGPGTAGGRYLRIEVDGSTGTTTGNSFDVAVMTGPSCDPAAAPLRCHSNAAFHQLDLDVPAGPVWVWVARTSSSTTAVTATVSISEVDPPRIEGDSCDNPYTTSSAIHSSPAANTHRFSIPRNVLRGADIDTMPAVFPNAFTCDTAAGHGIDGVIRFDKPDDTSVLRISAVRTAGSDSFNFAVFDACDAAAPATQSLGCYTGVTTTARELLVAAPAGPVYVWVGDTLATVSRSSSVWAYNNAIDVDVEVIPDVGTGEICGRAIAAATGVNTVTGTSDQRLHAPSCFGATSNVEWYRLRTTQEILIARANAAGGLALFDPSDMAELSCVSDALARSVTRVMPVGTELCVAVEMGRGITSIDLGGQSYTGLGSRPPVALNVLRPLSTTGTEESITTDYWMAVTDDTLLMRYSSQVLDVGRGGNERAVRRGSTPEGITSSMIGRTGVVQAGGVFSFYSTTSATTNRIFRLWDGTSPFWTPVTWDLSPNYVTAAIMAAAPEGTSNIVFVTDSSTVTTFYRISALAPSTPQLVGASTRLRSARGLAVDDQFAYVQATLDGVRGVYRVPLSDVTAEPVVLAQSTGFSSSTTQATAMGVDRPASPNHLYVRNGSGDVEVIIDPSGPSPFYLGPVIDRGTSSDWAMTVDPATGQLFLFETETDSNGVFLRYDP